MVNLEKLSWDSVAKLVILMLFIVLCIGVTMQIIKNFHSDPELSNEEKLESITNATTLFQLKGNKIKRSIDSLSLLRYRNDLTHNQRVEIEMLFNQKISENDYLLIQLDSLGLELDKLKNQ